MSKKVIKVPNIGEFKDVEVIEVLVKKGQEVKKNNPLITIESDKSSVEIPSTFEGKIIELNLQVGDKVSEGDKILEIKINEDSKIYRWFNCLAYSTLAALISRMIIFPANVLSESDYFIRFIVILLSILIFYLTKKNLVYPTVFSAIILFFINTYFVWKKYF